MFKIGDLVKFRSGYRSNLPCEYAVGEIIEDLGHSFGVRWRGFGDEIRYTKDHIASKQWWEKVEDPLRAVNVSGTDKKLVPETLNRRHGHIEDYLVKGRHGQTHEYRRYVYCVSGTHKKHHIPNRQKESIETLWRSGATAKQICIALGKSSEQTTLDPCRILTDVPL
ncbi:MAG: hypothetical protein NW214_08610 [Pseudanabaenaceae cyanobacterium bins.39]|nr:hypothetical protein [Pseudanabaenaceae cyanobacterium bins.39]